MKWGILGVFQVLVLGVLFNAYAFNSSVQSFEVSAAEASNIFGGVTCNGQELKNRCGNTTTNCDAPNDANFCDASSVGQSCVSAGGGGQYEGTGSALVVFQQVQREFCAMALQAPTRSATQLQFVFAENPLTNLMPV